MSVRDAAASGVTGGWDFTPLIVPFDTWIAVLNVLDEAEATHALLDNHLHLGKPLEREVLYAQRDSLDAALSQVTTQKTCSS